MSSIWNCTPAPGLEHFLPVESPVAIFKSWQHVKSTGINQLWPSSCQIYKSINADLISRSALRWFCGMQIAVVAIFHTWLQHHCPGHALLYPASSFNCQQVSKGWVTTRFSFGQEFFGHFEAPPQDHPSFSHSSPVQWRTSLWEELTLGLMPKEVDSLWWMKQRTMPMGEAGFWGALTIVRHSNKVRVSGLETVRWEVLCRWGCLGMVDGGSSHYAIVQPVEN